MSCSDLNNLSSCDFNYAKSYEIENSFLNLYHEGWQWSNGLKFCFDSDYACSASPYNWGAIYNYLLPHNQHPSTTPYILRFDIKPPSNIQLDKDSYLTVSNWQYGYNRDKTDLNFHLRELDSRKWYFEEGFVPWPEPILSSSPEPNSSSTSETIPEATSTPVATSTVATTSTSTNAKLEVVINEIAWMGTNASHSDEWIELYNNTSEEIDLNNWVLKSASGSPSTTLIGKIPANGFYLLERTSSTTISNIIEDQIFTGVLNNNCEVLELIDSSGNLQDKTICNGNNWPAGENQTGGNMNTIRASMERINPMISGESITNWCTNDTITKNGKDANNNPILGTPKAQNSCYLNSGG